MALVVWLREPELHLSPFELIHYVFLVSCNEKKTDQYGQIYGKKKDVGAALGKLMIHMARQGQLQKKIQVKIY